MAASLSWRDRIGVRLSRTAASVAGAAARIRNGRPDSVSRRAYGPDPAQYVDVFDVSGGVEVRAPIVFIHGGGWIAGNTTVYTRRLLEFAEVGHPVFNVEYPLAPEHPHPEILQSIIEALAWVRTHRPDYEGVYLMGDSAGGNLAMMAGIVITNPQAAEVLGIVLPDDLPGIRGVVSLCGVLDRLSWIEDGFGGASLMLRSYAGDDALAPEVGPGQAVTPMDVTFDALPPTFIVAAGKDALARSSRLCAEQLQPRFPTVEYKVYEEASHGFFTFNRSQTLELLDDIHKFLGSRNGPGAPVDDQTD